MGVAGEIWREEERNRSGPALVRLPSKRRRRGKKEKIFFEGEEGDDDSAVRARNGGASPPVSSAPASRPASRFHPLLRKSSGRFPADMRNRGTTRWPGTISLSSTSKNLLLFPPFRRCPRRDGSSSGGGARGARGNASGVPLAAARQSARSGHAPQRGARGVQTRAPSSMRAWLWSPGFRAGTSGRASARTRASVAGAFGSRAGRGGGRGRARRCRPRRARHAERDRRDGGGRVRADAGERAPALERARERARRRDGLRRAVEVAGARVVAEAAPLGEDLALRRAGERSDVRESARGSASSAGATTSTRRLLGHDLGEPDRVRVARAPPRQVALLAPVPAREAARHVARIRRSRRKSRLRAWSSTGKG